MNDRPVNDRRANGPDVYDIVVVGGGPAGLACALYAARAGLTSVVLEPRTAPIDKACGEGLMPGAVRALQDMEVAVTGHPLRGISYIDESTGRSAHALFDGEPGRGVRRTELHDAMTAAARAAGVVIRHEVATGISQSATGVRVGEVAGRYLIAADGLHSPLRRQLGLDRVSKQRRRWGIRAHFAVRPWSDCVQVHWAQHSEAYVTPVGSDLVGVAVLSGRQHDFASALAQFTSLQGRLQGRQQFGTRGAGPLRQGIGVRVAGRVLFVGDAAGYVDALTGEGLAVAFAGARAAVAAIVDDDPIRYQRDYLRLTWRPTAITHAALWAAQHDAVRRRIVAAAATAPVLFTAAVNQLAG